MFTLPIFVYSKKTPTNEYLNTVKITSNIPSEYNWDTATVTINSQTVTNPYYVDIRNGVELVTENGKAFIKVKDYYLSETFSNTTKLDESTALDSGFKRGLWSTSTTLMDDLSTASGTAGRLECAYEIETVGLLSTSATVTNAYALNFVKSISSKTSNTVVNEGTDTPANKIVLGANIADTATTSNGNSITGVNSFNNNPSFYPFFNKTTTTASSLYGLNNNSVPIGANITNINFSSATNGPYNLGGRLALGFDLYNGTTLVTQNVILPLLSNNSAYSTINSNLAISNFFSQNVILKNVQLKVVASTSGTITAQEFATSPFATTIFNVLNLTISGTYTNTSSTLLLTQPEITSNPFLLAAQDGTEFSGFGAITLSNIDSEYGIEVRARFSETLEGLQNANYTFLGAVTGTGSTSQTLYLTGQEQNPEYIAAASAKYVQVNLKSVINSNSLIYEQSLVDRNIVITQIDPRRRSFIYNSFPDTLKFGTAETETISSTLFGPFTIKAEGPEKVFTSGNKATYGKFGYKYGVIQIEHLNNKALTYVAKNNLNNNTEVQPTYTPSAAAATAFTSTALPSPNPLNLTKHLVLKYDVVVVQGDDKNPNITKYASSTPSTSMSAYLDSFFNTAEETNIKNPLENKTVYITANTSGNTSLPDQVSLNRHKAKFDVLKTASTTRTISTNCRTRCVDWNYSQGTEICCPGDELCRYKTCISPTCNNYETDCDYESVLTTVNSRYFTFGFTNFREVVLVYNPVDKSITEAWSKDYDINNNVDGTNTSEITGLWASDAVETINYIQPKFSTNETSLSFLPERIILPAINFDTISSNSLSSTKNFQAKIYIEFLNSSNQVVGSSISKTITSSTQTELILQVPSDISGAKKLRSYIGIEPVGLQVYGTGITGTPNTKLSITANKYKLQNFADYDTVGIEFISKPRIEYVDTTVTTTNNKRKKYYKSQVISDPYDLFTIASVTPYTVNGTNYPTLKGYVLLDGTTSIPEGTDLKIEWSASSSESDWSSSTWTTDTSDSGLRKRYVRYKISMTPENGATGYKTPILDEVKIKFWPYNVPYVEKYLLNQADTANKAVVSASKIVKLSDVEISVTSNGEAGTPVYTTLNPVETTTIASAADDVKLKIKFLSDEARLEETVVDLFTALA